MQVGRILPFGNNHLGGRIAAAATKVTQMPGIAGNDLLHPAFDPLSENRKRVP